MCGMYLKNDALISQILPSSARCSEQRGELFGHLLPEEASLLAARCSEKRRREFSAGRTCARAAVNEIYFPATPILVGPNREPLWPDGICGSITHCEGYCAAAVAHKDEICSLGIDGEPNIALPAEILQSVLLQTEISSLASARPMNLACDRLLFSIKESIFKLWYPVERSWLDFLDVHVELSLQDNEFEAAIHRQGRTVPRTIYGHYVATPDLLLTSCALRL